MSPPAACRGAPFQGDTVLRAVLLVLVAAILAIETLSIVHLHHWAPGLI
jgi:hypothetical protein